METFSSANVHMIITYQQSVFKRYHSDRHFLEFYLQDGGKNQLALIWNEITSFHPMYANKVGGVAQW